MCDTLVNTCGADQTAKNTCATAKTVADSKPAKTGAQADGVTFSLLALIPDSNFRSV